MKINYTYVNPGGNPTILVTSRQRRKDYAKIAKKFLRSKDLPCEQVGFLEAPKNPRAAVRVQMMGGEFCANALRSAAGMLALNNKKSSSKRSFSFTLESSGASKLIRSQVRIAGKGKIDWSQIEFPVSKKQLSIKDINLTISNSAVSGRLIKLEGITHLVVPAELQNKNINYVLLVPKLYKLLKISDEAFGLIFCSKISKAKLKILPIVYVPVTESVIFETSCASGAIAAVLASGTYKAPSIIRVLQPSKFWLEVSLIKNRFRIGGKIARMYSGAL